MKGGCPFFQSELSIAQPYGQTGGLHHGHETEKDSRSQAKISHTGKAPQKGNGEIKNVA